MVRAILHAAVIPPKGMTICFDISWRYSIPDREVSAYIEVCKHSEVSECEGLVEAAIVLEKSVFDGHVLDTNYAIHMATHQAAEEINEKLREKNNGFDFYAPSEN